MPNHFGPMTKYDCKYNKGVDCPLPEEAKNILKEIGDLKANKSMNKIIFDEKLADLEIKLGDKEIPCLTCGWNPAVVKERSKKILREQQSIEKNSEGS